MALINARSVKNKTLAINEEIIQHDWDILAITETWLKQNGDEAIVTERLPPGYTFHHVARPCGRGGGVAVVYRTTTLRSSQSCISQPLNLSVCNSPTRSC